MRSVKEVVLEKHAILMQDRDIDMESSEDLEFGRKNAIDSLGIVELIIAIEEELDIELDDCLTEIRKCKTVGDMIHTIEDFINSNRRALGN